MTETHDQLNLVDYAVGLLDPSAAQATETHLAICPQCRQEFEQLRNVDTALRDLPPEMFFDAPPAGGELALQRAIRQVRDEKQAASAEPAAREARPSRRRAPLIAAAVVAAALLSGGSWALGQQAGLGAAFTSLPPNGTRVSAASPTTDARITAVVTPASGWVRVSAQVTGIPAGEDCDLLVIDEQGVAHLAASWLVSPNPQGTTLTGAAVVAPGDVAAIAVRTVKGVEYVTVDV